MTNTLLASAFPTPFALAIFLKSLTISHLFFFLEIMNNLELERLLNEKLSTDRINDYAPNGFASRRQIGDQKDHYGCHRKPSP